MYVIIAWLRPPWDRDNYWLKYDINFIDGPTGMRNYAKKIVHRHFYLRGRDWTNASVDAPEMTKSASVWGNGFVNIVLVDLFNKSSPHPLPPRESVVEVLPYVSDRKRHQHWERGWKEGGKKRRTVCLWANWERANGRYVKTLIIWHTPPRGVLWGQGKVLQYGPDCFRYKFKQGKWLAKQWPPHCFDYKFKTWKVVS